MNKRNNSIDLLKTICMFGILILHFLSQGGILSELENNKTNFFVFWTLELLFMSSVNIFAFITGYLYVEKEKYNNKNIIKLIMTVFFYSIIITLIFYLFDLYNIKTLGIKQIIIGLFPPVIGRYWYITSYIMLFFLIPYINQLIRSIDKRNYKNLLLILTFAFCIFTIFMTKDTLKISYGYSPAWLIYCYLLGGYIKKYEVKYNKLMTIFLISFLILLILLKNISMDMIHVGKVFNLLISYNSPLIVLNSLIIFMFFKDKNIKCGEKFINYLSVTSFGVYIIHCHPFLYDFVLKGTLGRMFDVNSTQFIFIFIAIIFLIYLICSLIEYIKIQIFKTKLFSIIECKVTKLIDVAIGYEKK